MLEGIKNRMAKKQPKKKKEAEPEPAQQAPVVKVTKGVRCPCCGRATTPKVVKTKPSSNQKILACGLCGKKFEGTFENGDLKLVRPLS